MRNRSPFVRSIARIIDPLVIATARLWAPILGFRVSQNTPNPPRELPPLR